jgi:FtsP/CotA-like multicopper oxidase with cupredoxin domain
VNQPRRNLVGRRAFLKAAGIATASAATGLGFKRVLQPTTVDPYKLSASGLTVKRHHMVATDGFASMPVQANAIPPFWPDPDAADKAPYTVLNGKGTGLWVMGFRDVTAQSSFNSGTGEFDLNAFVKDQKGRAQLTAPNLYAQVGDDLRLHLTNLGLQQRPDLVDSHTIHFHGFPNQTAYFDGVPDASLAAPIGRTLVYRYIPEDPGTYMYHCHFEDVEHVHMGLTGLVFVLPRMGTNYAYDDASTRFDRQFAMLLSEADVHIHYNDAHLQINDFSAYAPTFRLMNGRAWPDTIEPNIDPATGHQVDGTSRPNLGRLQYNPLSSLIQANSGEKVLIRISNLGYEVHSLVLPGISMRMVGRDAKPLGAGRPDYQQALPAPGQAYAPGTRGDISVRTNRVDIGPGESRDLIFTAPTVTQKTVYPLYDRNDAFVHNGSSVSGDGYGGMRTEVHVFPPGSLGSQTNPNQLLTVGGGVNGDM